MTHLRFLRLSALPSAAAFFACLGLVAFCPQRATAAAPFPAGGTYIITNLDSTGAFSSRSVVTLNSDFTMSVVDSAQGGPTYYFSGQQGVWGVGTNGVISGRTLDFDFPSLDVARLDWTFTLTSNGGISGSVTLYTFPLTANPLGTGGTSGGTYTFTGYRVTLPLPQ
jgi:hypothetical protein